MCVEVYRRFVERVNKKFCDKFDTRGGRDVRKNVWRADMSFRVHDRKAGRECNDFFRVGAGFFLNSSMDF